MECSSKRRLPIYILGRLSFPTDIKVESKAYSVGSLYLPAQLHLGVRCLTDEFAFLPNLVALEKQYDRCNY